MRVCPPKYYAYAIEVYLVCGLSKEVKLRYKGLHGHHTGIITLQDGKLETFYSTLPQHSLALASAHVAASLCLKEVHTTERMPQGTSYA
ncbi:hypothetical protein KY285_007343 [Solanum tuberosum]|nr:hypothetical protein KY285_007343 [Solanum tuberosum]